MTGATDGCAAPMSDAEAAEIVAVLCEELRTILVEQFNETIADEILGSDDLPGFVRDISPYFDSWQAILMAAGWMFNRPSATGGEALAVILHTAQRRAAR